MGTCTDQFTATCRIGSCRKRCYPTRAAAKLAARRDRARAGYTPKLRVYQHGPHWHHTSQSAAVIAYHRDALSSAVPPTAPTARPPRPASR